jgi:uncharacterized membrane protein YfcA
MILPADFGWLMLVGLAAQVVDRSMGTGYVVSASALLVTLTVSVVLWLQLGRFTIAAPVALILGAAAGLPLAAFLTRHLPGRAAALGVGIVIFALAAAGLQLSLT